MAWWIVGGGGEKRCGPGGVSVGGRTGAVVRDATEGSMRNPEGFEGVMQGW